MKKFGFLLIFSAILAGCKEDKTEVYTQSAKDAALAEQLTIDVLKEVLMIAPEYVISESYSDNTDIILSAEPEISSPTYPKTITIDYGNGVSGILGKTRSGKILLTVNSGTIITEDLDISFENFKSDGSEILGNITYTFNSSTEGYDGEFEGSGISIINANGTMKMDGTFNLEKISTAGTTATTDDIYNFNCRTTGIDFDQTSFTYNSTVDHTIDFSCIHMIKAGKSSLAPNGKGEQTVDFGSGNCDATGSIRLSSGESKNFIF